MANTTNLDLVKPAGTDHALISVLNSNSDKIDAFAGQTNDSLSAEQNGLAYIVGNTNTTGGTLAAGQFVYVKGHSTIAEGLRKVTSSISANGSITTSNTDACSEGGLNALNSKIGEIHYFNFGVIASASAPAFGAKLESTINFDCAFVGVVDRGGLCFVSGYHYMAGANHYWNAIMVRFDDCIIMSGIAGSYKQGNITLNSTT